MTVQIALLLLLVATGSWLLREPRVRIGERGLRLRGSGLGWVPWHAIDGVWQPSGSDTDALHVRLRADVLPHRPDRLTLRIDLRGTELTAAELVQEILRRAAAAAPLPLRRTGTASRLSS